MQRSSRDIDAFLRPMNSTRAAAAAIGLGGAAISTVAAIPVGYVTVLGAIGTRRVRAARRDRRPSTSFTLLMPAHDEADGIGRSLRSIAAADYPAELLAVHVVADNCTDATADVVRRNGFEVHERADTTAPGKGPALNWLLDRLETSDRVGDVVVVVDADTDVDPDFFVAMDEVFRTGKVAVAQGFYSVRDPDASPATSFRYAALACRHHVRSLGRRRLGGSCGLYGNGMAFKPDVLHDRPWSNHLVEDAELQIELLLDGVMVEYVADAIVRAEMPTALDQSESQQRRWERGRIEIARRFLPRISSAWRDGAGPSTRRALADAMFDLTLPPLSVLFTAHMTAAALALPGAALGRTGDRRTVLVSGACVALVAAHAICGLAAVGADRSHYRSLLDAPRIVAWKTALWLRSLLPGGTTDWVRTRRATESP